MNTKVSICVAQYNRADRILESIGSLLHQNYDNYEVIVVNDGSSDANTQIALESIDDPRLTVIFQENSGFVSAMNHAISLATGEYIAIHGAGDVSLPDRIKKQAAFLDQHPEHVLVSCKYSDVPVGEDAMMDESQACEYDTQSGEVEESDLSYKPSPFGHGEVMYRRDAFYQVGQYRRFFKFAQDKDLWLRMIKVGRFYILNDNLYRRGLFKKDGIATDLEKLYMQKLLMAFAVQIYETKMQFGFDLLERYGDQAALLRKPSKKVAKFCTVTAYRQFMNENLESARLFCQRSRRERLSLGNLVVTLILTLSRNTFLRTLILRGMLRIKHIKSAC